MQIGIIGAGNMGRALARGWGEPILLTDSGSGRAEKLAAEIGGKHVATNRELAKQSDLVVLCHKPYQLEPVALEIKAVAARVVSVLGGISTRRLQEVYPDSQVFAVMPNTP
ncbi:MAG: pyrroline-5-carboxylate reductase family protein, partial [Solirubrobacteraceae bacterium]